MNYVIIFWQDIQFVRGAIMQLKNNNVIKLQNKGKSVTMLFIPGFR